jgi:hypothetical protein
MLLHGSEIWGLQQHTEIEKVHLFALKKLLNVSPKTPNDMVYGETGRHPLYVFTYISCIKYWLRLTSMENFRLPKKAYNMQLALHNSGKVCWVSQVREVLYTFGFGFVWENQGVQTRNVFIRVFKQRLIDCHSQNWHEHINESVRFNVYRTFKKTLQLEPYFNVVANKHIRDILIRFRVGASDIRTHKMRYKVLSPQDLKCPLCDASLEDELHTLFYCKALSDLRAKYIPERYSKYPSFQTLEAMMQDANFQSDIGRFLYHGNKRRPAT